jgi:putative intracellular protease/amidase
MVIMTGRWLEVLRDRPTNRNASIADFEKPHKVAPDICTGASLLAAALYPRRFRSLVVGTGGAAVPFQFDRYANVESDKTAHH